MVRSQCSLLESKFFWGLNVFIKYLNVFIKYLNDFVDSRNAADEDIALGYEFLNSGSVKSVTLSLRI